MKIKKNTKLIKIEGIHTFYFYKFSIKFMKFLLSKYIFIKNVKKSFINNTNSNKKNCKVFYKKKIKLFSMFFTTISVNYYNIKNIKKIDNNFILNRCIKIIKLNNIIFFFYIFNSFLKVNFFKFNYNVFNKNTLLSFLTNLIDQNNINLFSNKHLIDLLFLSNFDKNFFYNFNKKKSFFFYNNYYPVFFSKYVYINFLKNLVIIIT